MNAQELTIYRDMLYRWRHFDWPGRAPMEPFATKYPNILAEMDATGWTIYSLIDSANVSKEIMAAAIEDNEELTFEELCGVSRFFWSSKVSYIADPVLQIIDPATNKGKARRRELSDLMKQMDGLSCWNMIKHQGTLRKLEGGEPVTYAAWRWAIRELKEEQAKQAHKKQRRTVRRATA